MLFISKAVLILAKHNGETKRRKNNYSYRRAMIGSTFVARRAGM